MLRTVQHDDIVVAVGLRTEQDLALSADDRAIVLWQACDGAVLRRFPADGDPFRSACLSRDYRRLACGGFFGQVSVRETESEETIFTASGFSPAPVNCVSFSRDGTYLLAGSGDGAICVWDLATGEVVFSMRQGTCVSQAHLIEEDGLILTDHGRDLRLWDTGTGACARAYCGHTAEVRAVAISADGTQALSAAEDSTLRLWDVQSGTCVQTLLGHEHWVMAAAFSPDGRQAVSGGRDHTVRLWDLSDGECLHVFAGHTDPVRHVAFGADGRTIISGANDMTARLWRI